MDRTDWFLALIVYLLAIIAAEFLTGDRPLIQFSLLALQAGIPLYLFAVLVAEHLLDESVTPERFAGN